MTSYSYADDGFWRLHWSRIRTIIGRHIDKSDGQLAHYIRQQRPGLAVSDITRARIFLGGQSFPEDAPHDERVRLFWVAAHLAGGLWAHMEYRVGNGYCDVMVMSDNRTPLAVIEVKTGKAHKGAVLQVVRYQELSGAPVAVVTAPDFTDSARIDADRSGVLLLSGAQTLDLIRDLAAEMAEAS